MTRPGTQITKRDYCRQFCRASERDRAYCRRVGGCKEFAAQFPPKRKPKP